MNHVLHSSSSFSNFHHCFQIQPFKTTPFLFKSLKYVHSSCLCLSLPSFKTSYYHSLSLPSFPHFIKSFNKPKSSLHSPIIPLHAIKRDECTAKNKFLKSQIPLVADYIPLDIIYEDEHIFVIDKPPGVKHEPLHRFVGGSLVNRVIGYLRKVPFTVHRLDMYTSGVICFAKNKNVAAILASQFRSHHVEKRYLVLVLGQVCKDFEIDAPIGRNPNHKFARMVCDTGKIAKTKFCVLASNKKSNISLLEAQIFSGRTHQIRVHLQHANFPILGDEIYGEYIPNIESEHSLASQASFENNNDNCSNRNIIECKYMNRQALHASYLRLLHPYDNTVIEFYSPLHDDMSRTIHEFFAKDDLKYYHLWKELYLN